MQRILRQLPAANLKQHPQSVFPKLKGEINQITIGDLHGNAIKLIYFLIQEGALTLDRDIEKGKALYKELYDIYLKKPEDLSKADLKRFKKIINDATLDPDFAVRLIGDELCDRGSNDYFTLMIMKRLVTPSKGIGIPVGFEVLDSNHSRAFLEAFQDRCLEKIDYESNIYAGDWVAQDKSFANFMKIKDLGLLENEDLDEVQTIVEDIYKPSLKIISYVENQNDNTLEVITHAPQDLSGIKEIAKIFAVEFRDNKPLKTIIDEINEQYSRYLSGELLLSAGKENVIHAFVWRRYSDFPPLQQTGMHNGVKLLFMHGHDAPGKSPSGVTNLDNVLGKKPGYEEERYETVAQTRLRKDFPLRKLPARLSPLQKNKLNHVNAINSSIRFLLKNLTEKFRSRYPNPEEVQFFNKIKTSAYLVSALLVERLKTAKSSDDTNTFVRAAVANLSTLTALSKPETRKDTPSRDAVKNLFATMMERYKKLFLDTARDLGLAIIPGIVDDFWTQKIHDINAKIDSSSDIDKSFQENCDYILNDLFTNVCEKLREYYISEDSMVSVVADKSNYLLRFNQHKENLEKILKLSIQIAGLSVDETNKYQNEFVKISTEAQYQAGALTSITNAAYILKRNDFQERINNLMKSIPKFSPLHPRELKPKIDEEPDAASPKPVPKKTPIAPTGKTIPTASPAPKKTSRSVVPPKSSSALFDSKLGDSAETDESNRDPIHQNEEIDTDSLSTLSSQSLPKAETVKNHRLGIKIDATKHPQILAAINNGDPETEITDFEIKQKGNVLEIRSASEPERCFYQYTDGHMMTKDKDVRTFKGMLRDWFSIEKPPTGDLPDIKTTRIELKTLWQTALRETLSELKLQAHLKWEDIQVKVEPKLSHRIPHEAEASTHPSPKFGKN